MPVTQFETAKNRLGIMATPNVYRLVTGSAEANTSLNAFDIALLQAGIGDTNLVRMSSILPPGAQHVSRLELPKGALVPVAYAALESEEKEDQIAAAVGVGSPEDSLESGVIMEYKHHGAGQAAEDKVRKMVEDAFAYRRRELAEVISVSVDYRVKNCGAVFAGVVLWYDEKL